MKPNTGFNLNVRDIDLIESCMRAKINVLTTERLGVDNPSYINQINKDIREIHDLLGKIHQQKNFYRPKDNYVGG